jgi:hypothetical protein
MATIRVLGAAVPFIFGALLTACGASPAQEGSAALPQATRIAAPTLARTMRKSTSQVDLLYVSSISDGIFVLTYPQGDVEAKFQPPDAVSGAPCADDTGDVFVTTADGGSGYIYEYAHGGTSPTATLGDNGYVPLACSVDPKTGNLAVVNYGNEEDNIAIYGDAQGTPTYYTDSNMDKFYYCAYDDNGNLFVDGVNEYNPDQPKLTELPYGNSSFTGITLNKSIGRPGSLQWRGAYLAIGANKKIIYHVAVSGSTGTVVGKTVPAGLRTPWLIQGNALISPYGRSDGGAWEIAYWKYPKANAPTTVINAFGTDSLLNGVAISIGSGN